MDTSATVNTRFELRASGNECTVYLTPEIAHAWAVVGLRDVCSFRGESAITSSNVFTAIQEKIERFFLGDDFPENSEAKRIISKDSLKALNAYVDFVVANKEFFI